MKKIIFLITILLIQNITIAYEVLPDIKLNDSTNPYRKTLKQKLKDVPIQLKNNPKTEEFPKENYALSRMEREWFKKEFPHLEKEERVERLEEKLFGTIQSGNIEQRINNLKDAFDTQKLIQAKEHSYGYNIFSGLPTSVPMNVDELLGQ